MATIVNLNFGGEPTSHVYTADLVLKSPYEHPVGTLLVLRSAPDIEPITASLIAVEQADVGYLEVIVPQPVEPISATLISISAHDVVTLVGVTDARDITTTLIATESSDVVEFTGEGYVGIGVRHGALVSIELPDAASLTSNFLMKWVATAAGVETQDVASFNFGFIEYTGPGFINGKEKPDIVEGLLARLVYDVSGTLISEEFVDQTEITVLTNRQEVEAIEDALVVSETLTGVVVSDILRDTLLISEELDDSALPFADAAVITENLSGAVWLQGTIQEDLQPTEQLGVVLHGPLVDTLAISETLNSQFLLPELVDTLAIIDVLHSHQHLLGGLSDVVYITEEIASSAWVEIVDVLTISETLVGNEATSAPVLADALLITETLVNLITVYAPTLEEDAPLLISELLGSSLVLAGVLSDTLIASDMLLGQTTETVHVVNAETGAVSTYLFTHAVRGMAQFQGTLYLATANGLFAVDAEQDDDGDIVWTMQTGFSNLGTDLLKRIRDVNCQARTKGDITLQVISDRYGRKQQWQYRLPPMTRESYRDGVVKPGRGIQSVYYALGLQGVGPAEIDQLRVAVEPLSRRR